MRSIQYLLQNHVVTQRTQQRSFSILPIQFVTRSKTWQARTLKENKFSVEGANSSAEIPASHTQIYDISRKMK